MIWKSDFCKAAFGRLGILLIFAAGFGCRVDPKSTSDNKDASISKTDRIDETSSKSALPRYHAPGRLIAVGDLHGDLSAARRVFRLAEVIDSSDRWVGGNSVVVQVGDLIDRSDDDRALLEWMEKTASASAKKGGAVYRVLGNHELMNVAGDMRYVTQKSFADFSEYAKGNMSPAVLQVKEAYRGRIAAFLPGGVWAVRLASYPAVTAVDDTVFAHGGVLTQHVETGIARINKEVAEWLLGGDAPSAEVDNADAPFWNRTFGGTAADADCRKLDETLKALSVRRLVIGHTPQQHGITFACDGKVARIDVGLSKYYGDNLAQALEIRGDAVRVLVEDRAGNPDKQ